MKESISYYTENKVGYISLDKPPANGYDIVYLQQLSQTISEINVDKRIKVVVIQSNLPKFFCGGADIKVFAANTIEENQMMVVAARNISDLISKSDKVYIAAIKGHSLGGGLELAMACDLRIAAKGNYLLGLPEIKLGLIPGNGGTIRLIHLIGAGRAMDLLLTGDSITPEIAHQYGLINRLYPEQDFASCVIQFAENLASGPGKAMALTKKYCNKSRGMTIKDGLALEKKYVDSLYNTNDAMEGFNAFIEKRPPQFD
jgi:enoyl-CoA hydratase